MNSLHDLMAKLANIEEAAKFSDIPAAQRKEKYPHGWKSTLKDLEAEEHEGKISHPKTLAKNSGKQVTEWDDGGDDTRGDANDALIQDAMQKLGISLNDINSENVWDIGEKISQAIGSGYNDYYRTDSEHRDVPAEDVLDYLSSHIDLSDLSEEATEVVNPETTPTIGQGGGGAGAADESIEECGDMPMAQGHEGGKVELSMNDLLKLIAQMSKGQEPNVGHGEQPLLGDEYENEPNTSVAPASAMTPTGDDLFSKGDEAEKVNGGGNPLQAQLAELYAQIKEAKVNELSTQTLSSYVKKRGAQLSGGYEDKDKVKGLNAALRKVKQNSAKQNAAPTLKEANQMVRKLRK